ncbi:unnamed protein product [Dicrocoelium dendriticum]|nr:unnamed protein product [Dicrocoelium dendriticum]
MRIPGSSSETAFFNATSATNTTLKMPTTLKPDDGEDGWTQLLTRKVLDNDTRTYLGIQTAFHVKGYSRYEQTPGQWGRGSSPNRMIPIYCSVMGMVILIVLFYVMYKLWKQRNSIANAKLSEDYGVVACNGHHGSVAATLHGSTITGPDGASRSNMNTHNIVEILTEKVPLINQVDDPIRMCGLTERTMASLSCNAIGNLCIQLALDGWKRLAVIMDFNPDELVKPDEEMSDTSRAIIQASLQAQNLNSDSTFGQQCPRTEELIKTAALLSKMCANSGMNLGTLSDALTRIGRVDLVPLLSNGSVNAKALREYVA